VLWAPASALASVVEWVWALVLASAWVLAAEWASALVCV
jgi:hypothetical protein